MNIDQKDAKIVSIRLNPKEASHLLDGLKNYHEVLGNVAQELEQRLLKAGIREPEKPDHIRYEYMPPD